MYLKVEKDSPIYGKLSQIFIEEDQRNKSFKKWMTEHLPPFNGDVITERMAWSLSVVVVGWKFDGEVDSKTWQPMKEFPDYYEPNRRTKAGKRMRERIYAAMGNMFNCINFFEMFGTSIPYYGKSFTVPKGFLHNDTVYMIFDDANYNDISKNMAGQFTEITTGEFNEALDLYNESKKGKGL